MLRFISLGSGSSGNCYYLQTADDALLIDAGVGLRTLKKHLHNYGLRLDSVKHILITHDHADHVKSVGIISSEYNIPVYAINEVHNGIYRNYCVPRKIPADNVRHISKGEKIRLGDFIVTPFAVPHDSSGNVGYRIEAEGVTFCLMTDVGHVTEEMQDYIAEANYLVIEANYDVEMLKNGPYPQHLKVRIDGPTGHLSNVACGEAIANYATTCLKRVWLCHLSEENNHPVLALKTVEQTLRSYGIIIGKDFIVEDLKRKSPSELYELV
ncbi:MAG: MBL fold metallo-hydrolase [Prevotella sp.]|nr:MBL fold metallo-hydrolase [Prevotella sp.]MDD6509871.1 MBL fold metallo-hydrolase [Prevotella sp.]MDD7246979.1 MBL fold metallo-hydrolase [Prevotellaceae bacterium]MDY2749675.1 MBL fold metallo-hydrolase [Prevotella sp.]